MPEFKLSLAAKLKAINERDKPIIDLSTLSPMQLFAYRNKERNELMARREKLTNAAVKDTKQYPELNTDEYRERFKQMDKELEGQIDELDKVLLNIAIQSDMVIPLTIQWHKWKTISSSDYQRQSDSVGYAKGLAELLKEFAVDSNIPVRIQIEYKSKFKSWLNHKRIDDFHVEVQTTKFGCRIMDYRYIDWFHRETGR